MGRKPSIVHQTKTAINAVDRIGKGKREARIKGELGIHSLKQKKETLSVAQNYVKWARGTYGIKNLYELREDHYRGYIEHLQDKGLTNGHMRNVETGLRHLQKGMAIRSERFQKEPVIFCPDKRIIGYKPDPVKDRSYSEQEYQQILNNVPTNSRDAVMLSREMGLRIREACNVRVEHFQKNEQGWKLKIEKGGGITKGGRFRETPVPKHFEKELERMVRGKEQMDTLVSVKSDTVRRAVNKACKKTGILQNGRGTHGFRHAFTRERVDQLLDQQGIKDAGRKMIDRIMENRDQGRSAYYGILDHNKELFDKVKSVIDQVHSEIGHGKDRWDLASVYMR